MTAAAKGSSAGPMIFTKDEATAAQRTWLFHLVKTADQADCITVVPVVTISKAGAAFGAAVGVVSELADGWYKIVFDAGDVDTIGCLAVRVAVATADTLDITHQVTALDLNTATVNPGAGGIVAASFGAAAIDAAAIAPAAIGASELATDAIGATELSDAAVTKINVGMATAASIAAISLATRTVVVSLGTIEEDGALNADGDICGVSMLDAIDCTVSVTGTWDGATATIQTTEDPAAAEPVWTDYVDAATDNPLTDDGSIIVTGPHSAVRVLLSSEGATTELAVSASIRKASGS